jgi:hypothetical protein
MWIARCCENLKLTFEQRARKHLRVLQMVEELRRWTKSCDRKEAAGRPKDREAIAEIRVLLEETKQRQPKSAQVSSATRAC